MSVTKLALAFAAAIGLGLAFVSSAGANQPDVQISRLECDTDPELVVIENKGSAEQSFTGWKLQSDPASSQEFDLSTLGGLQPQSLVFIQSGPSASGVFVWSQQVIFRDGDSTDYARIVDSNGDIVHQVNCEGGAAASPTPASRVTPTPAPRATPTPTAEPTLTPGAAPNGGGPPPPPGASAVSPGLLLAIGGSMATLGLAAIARPWAVLRGLLPGGASSAGVRPAAAALYSRRVGARASRVGPVARVIRMALVVLAVLVVFSLSHRRTN